VDGKSKQNANNVKKHVGGMTMYPELDQFENIKNEYDTETEQLKEKQKTLENRKAIATQQYNKTLTKVVYDGDRESAVELTELKHETQELVRQLKEVKEQIEQIRLTKHERLKSLLPSLKEGRDREVEAAAKHLRSKKDDLRRYRAEYLLLIQQLYEIRKYTFDIDTVFKKTAKTMTHEYEHGTLSLPNINLHNPYGVEDALGILESEVQQVYKTGKLPAWVVHYSEHMELLNDEEASERLTKKSKYNA
jgi:hypothetical protein